jgi:aminoglycoside 6'-N-acetyltransferase I
MKIDVREMRASDRVAWAEMRAGLWPEETAQAHAREIDDVLGSERVWGFIAETPDRVPAGFAEVAIRPYANGCESRPVPFLEGIWVNAQFRRQGVGAALIAHIEAFLSSSGYCELGSDTPIDNGASRAAHLGWEFSETERVIYFRKTLAFGR